MILKFPRTSNSRLSVLEIITKYKEIVILNTSRFLTTDKEGNKGFAIRLKFKKKEKWGHPKFSCFHLIFTNITDTAVPQNNNYVK